MCAYTSEYKYRLPCRLAALHCMRFMWGLLLVGLLQPRRASGACACCGGPTSTPAPTSTPSGGCPAGGRWTRSARSPSPGTTSRSPGLVWRSLRLWNIANLLYTQNQKSWRVLLHIMESGVTCNATASACINMCINMCNVRVGQRHSFLNNNCCVFGHRAHLGYIHHIHNMLT